MNAVKQVQQPLKIFCPFFLSLITYLTVWCTCRAFTSTEEADAVKRHRGDVSVKSATPPCKMTD